MKIISSTTHGVLDYSVGLILIISPWLLGFSDGGPETWVPVILGISAFAYSIITKYEAGVFNVISFKTHLIIDTLSAILFIVSPWLFGFAKNVFIPHLFFGLLELVVVILTKPSVTTGKKNVTANIIS